MLQPAKTKLWAPPPPGAGGVVVVGVVVPRFRVPQHHTHHHLKHSEEHRQLHLKGVHIQELVGCSNLPRQKFGGGGGGGGGDGCGGGGGDGGGVVSSSTPSLDSISRVDFESDRPLG